MSKLAPEMLRELANEAVSNGGRYLGTIESQKADLAREYLDRAKEA